jgi:transposase
VEGSEVARVKKIAARQGRVIVFIDESGLSERPCRARTWAPRGQTPVLQYSFSWKQLSVIAGVSFWRFYFRLYGGTIRTPQVIEFLKALQATIGKKLLIIWDRLQAHRSKLVRAHVEAQRGAIALEFLPAYAPELNPVECIWGYLKHHAMPNYCARNLGDLAHRARRSLRSMQRRSTLVCAFWRQAELF